MSATAKTVLFISPLPGWTPSCPSTTTTRKFLTLSSFQLTCPFDFSVLFTFVGLLEIFTTQHRTMSSVKTLIVGSSMVLREIPHAKILGGLEALQLPITPNKMLELLQWVCWIKIQFWLRVKHRSTEPKVVLGWPRLTSPLYRHWGWPHPPSCTKLSNCSDVEKPQQVCRCLMVSSSGSLLKWLMVPSAKNCFLS